MKGLVRGLLILVLIALPVGLGWLVWSELGAYRERHLEPHSTAPMPIEVEIPRGSSATEAVARLVEAGVLTDGRAAMAVLRSSGIDRTLHAGHYRFERPVTPAEVVARLASGDVLLRQVTIPEGWSRYEIAERVAAAGIDDAESFLKATTAVDLIADLDPTADDLDGYLFPDTYALGPNDGSEALVRQMIQGFRRAFGDDGADRAQALGLTVREVVILASLVEKETAQADERGLVAGVYRARLQVGMKLQADPTIIYGLQRENRWDGDLKRSDITDPHPYNTYVHRGLPPGPIANPGRAALQASLAPEDTPFLYFVSKNDGSHVFARTLREHNHNVEIHQRRYWKKKWAEAGGRKRFLAQQPDAKQP